LLGCEVDDVKEIVMSKGNVYLLGAIVCCAALLQGYTAFAENVFGAAEETTCKHYSEKFTCQTTDGGNPCTREISTWTNTKPTGVDKTQSIALNTNNECRVADFLNCKAASKPGIDEKCKGE
jgi:hypothetical protein